MMMDTKLMDDLEALLPRARVITTAGGDIVVSPLVTAQIPPFLRYARPLFDALDEKQGAVGALPVEQDGVVGVAVDTDIDWISMLETHGESIIQAVAVATGQTPAAIGRLPPDQTVALVQAILEENLDFFVLRLLPAVTRLMAGVVGQLRMVSDKAGPTSSSGSSATGIGAATS